MNRSRIDHVPVATGDGYGKRNCDIGSGCARGVGVCATNVTQPNRDVDVVVALVGRDHQESQTLVPELLLLRLNVPICELFRDQEATHGNGKHRNQ